MNTTISRLRQRYKPKTIKVLFVAESPPAESPPKSLDEEVRFFYNPRQERWDHMYRSVMKAVFPDFEYRFGEKDKWLRRFSDDGYYMIDATDSPVNRLSSSKTSFRTQCRSRWKVIRDRRIDLVEYTNHFDKEERFSSIQ
ncbi:MAG: hypothetical protein WCA45_14665 [Thiobacillaceae bacterium]